MPRPRGPTGEPRILKRKDKGKERFYTAIRHDGKRKWLYGETRGEVQRKLDAVKAQIAAGRSFSQESPFVSDYLNKWLERKRAETGYQTWNDYRYSMGKHVIPLLGDVRLNQLRPMHFDRLHAAMQLAGIAVSTQRKVRAIFRAALADAVLRGELDRNPSSRVRLPKRDQKDYALLTIDQMQRFLVEAKTDPHGLLWAIFALTGLRVSEVLALRWGDIDWQAGTLRVDGQMAKSPEGRVRTVPKSRASRRLVYLPSQLVEALRNAYHPENTGYLFGHGPKGKPYTTQSAERWLETYCAKIDLPRLTPHALRHQWTSMLLVAGVPVQVIQTQAGHSSPAVTLSVYAHSQSAWQRMASDALERLFKGDK